MNPQYVNRTMTEIFITPLTNTSDNSKIIFGYAVRFGTIVIAGTIVKVCARDAQDALNEIAKSPAVHAAVVSGDLIGLKANFPNCV